ncbi:MAG: helix-hairpin-helix domain-containing protein [Tannerella sp.]|jgi:DNA uptake protein ComE-like DNA-binding protein|nr:helix-hairpin-helix domain-containing protein [Tannerella sp.]
MSWRDYFYFPNNERRALTVLLCMIAAGSMFSYYTEMPSPAKDTGMAVQPEAVGTNPAAAQPSPSAVENQPLSDTHTRESVSARARRIITQANRPAYARRKKFAVGTIVELNAADTLTLQKVPGIGSYYARRIVQYRDRLGGFYTIGQLGEAYGIDADKYAELAPWFTVDPSLVRKMPVNTLPVDSLNHHPYISYRQAHAIDRLRKQKRLDNWENLQRLNVFTGDERERMEPYLSFE